MRPIDPRRTLTLIAITALAAVTGCGSAQHKPAAPVVAAKTFESKRYRFDVALTGGWSEADAHVDWDGKELQGLASSAFANFTDATTDRTLVVGAAPVAKGTQLASWRAAMVRAAPSVCSDSSSARHTTLGGEPALAWTTTCSDGYDVDKLAAVHGKRGYVMLLASATASRDADDRRIFESIRRSFRFTP